MNGINILEEQDVGGLIKLRRIFKKYDKDWNQLAGFGVFVMKFEWYIGNISDYNSRYQLLKELVTSVGLPIGS